MVLLHLCAMACSSCQTSASFEADLTRALDGQIGAGNWLLVDVLFQDPSGAATDITDANNWRTAHGTPAVTLHGEGGPALQEFVAGLGIVNTPTYVVVAPDGTVGAVREGFSQNGILIDAVEDVPAEERFAVPLREVDDRVHGE